MEFLIVYLTGAVLYGSIEALWRGWTHWTMLVLGGGCFVLIYLISAASLPFILKPVVSAAVITLLELGTGYLVNITLNWQVWDYSAMPANFMGQVCALYSLFWFLLSVPALLLCSLIRRVMPTLLGA